MKVDLETAAIGFRILARRIGELERRLEETMTLPPNYDEWRTHSGEPEEPPVDPEDHRSLIEEHNELLRIVRDLVSDARNVEALVLALCSPEILVRGPCFRGLQERIREAENYVD